MMKKHKKSKKIVRIRKFLKNYFTVAAAAAFNLGERF